jgi:hypothetical protein
MRRPWTVYALVALWVVGLVAPYVVDTSVAIGDPANAPDYPSWANVVFFLIGAGITAGLWMGKTWAYSLSLILTVLSAVALVLALAFGSFSIWAIVQIALGLFLLLHPATRRFAGWRREVPATSR